MVSIPWRQIIDYRVPTYGLRPEERAFVIAYPDVQEKVEQAFNNLPAVHVLNILESDALAGGPLDKGHSDYVKGLLAAVAVREVLLSTPAFAKHLEPETAAQMPQWQQTAKDRLAFELDHAIHLPILSSVLFDASMRPTAGPDAMYGQLHQNEIDFFRDHSTLYWKYARLYYETPVAQVLPYMASSSAGSRVLKDLAETYIARSVICNSLKMANPNDSFVKQERHGLVQAQEALTAALSQVIGDKGAALLMSASQQMLTGRLSGRPTATVRNR